MHFSPRRWGLHLKAPVVHQAPPSAPLGWGDNCLCSLALKACPPPTPPVSGGWPAWSSSWQPTVSSDSNVGESLSLPPSSLSGTPSPCTLEVPSRTPSNGPQSAQPCTFLSESIMVSSSAGSATAGPHVSRGASPVLRGEPCLSSQACHPAPHLPNSTAHPHLPRAQLSVGAPGKPRQSSERIKCLF